MLFEKKEDVKHCLFQVGARFAKPHYGLSPKFLRAAPRQVYVPVLENSGVWFEDNYRSQEEPARAAPTGRGKKLLKMTKPVRELSIFSQSETVILSDMQNEG